MIKKETIRLLNLLLGTENVLIEEPMSNHTTFKIGGNADLFITPTSYQEIMELVPLLEEHNIPCTIIGKGSNLVVSDKGIRGAVICTSKMQAYRRNGDKLTVYCGKDIIQLANYAAKISLSGLEFACGIPGTVGGAVYMNAGAYDSEISQILLYSKVFDMNTKLFRSISKDDHKFAYRYSSLQDNQHLLVSSTFLLKPLSGYTIKAQMEKLNKARSEKQPLELPSAGSVFRRPEGYYTGKLIEECGLKGFKIGGAEVSTKHCGFIVNTGHATAEDVKNLVLYIRKTVLERFGVNLQTEIKFIGAE